MQCHNATPHLVCDSIDVGGLQLGIGDVGLLHLNKSEICNLKKRISITLCCCPPKRTTWAAVRILFLPSCSTTTPEPVACSTGPCSVQVNSSRNESCGRPAATTASTSTT